MTRIVLLFCFTICAPAIVSAEEPAPLKVRCLETDDTIVVKLGNKPVLQYNKTTRESPEGIDPVYRRGGHIHPVYTPDGKELTGDFPADHPHQHGLFSAWRMVEFEGRKISFWDQLSQTGRVSHAKVISTDDGTASGKFVVELLLEDLTAPTGPKPVLRETWTVEVFNRGNDTFVFDIKTEQRCAGPSPVTIPKYHYGGMAIRGNDQWYSDQSQAAYSEWEKKLKTAPDTPRPPLDVMRHDFLTSEGRHQYDGNHTRPNWVDLYGPIDSDTAGIAILCHPDNFRAPQHVRLHPSKPYFCFSPMVDEAFEITPANPFVSKYRFVVHSGEPKIDAIDAEWKRFAAEF